MAKVLVLYYSSYGHVEAMAKALAEGVIAGGAQVDIKRVPETVPEDVARGSHYKLDQDAPVASVGELPGYDAIAVGTGTRYGRVSSQMAAFLARYLHDKSIRVEINDGLNVIEQWNSANDFIFFARRGEVSSNRREDQEASMLSLHLLQNCMVYVNTLMIQKVLARPEWKGRLTARDLHALTPLFWTHVNPYGRFDLDMHTRITALA